MYDGMKKWEIATVITIVLGLGLVFVGVNQDNSRSFYLGSTLMVGGMVGSSLVYAVNFVRRTATKIRRYRSLHR